MRRRALLFVMTLVWMAVWVPPAYAAFRLERADGSAPTRGLNIPGTLVLADVHWPVVDAPPPPPPSPMVRQPTRLPSAPSGGCYTEPGTPPQGVLDQEVKSVGYKSNRYNGGETYSQEGRNGHSSASGCWQFVRGTWNNYGGYRNAADAPVSVQNKKAKQTWAGGAGCGHWSYC